MEARGTYDFTATADGELSFRRGDILKILSSQDEWCKAEMQGKEGYVPLNYIERQTPSWFQENASRGTAEEFLMPRDVGGFLIRGCQSSPGDFSISVKHEFDVQHFRVMKDTKGHYFLWADKFTSLNKLVDFYKTTSISMQREIYLNEGIKENRSPSAPQPLKRGSLPEPRSYGNVSATTQRRASDQPRSQLSKRPGLEERAQTIGSLPGKSSPVSSVSASRRTADTTPQRAPSTQVMAVYDFKAEEDDELGFSAGDVIDVLDRSDALWWRGRARGYTGLFPANYTAPL